MRTTLPSGTAVEVQRPDSEPTRGLVIAPDIMGLRGLFDDMVETLSRKGWTVAAVEPWPGREDLTVEDRVGAMSGLDDGLQVGDLVAAADLLGVEPVGVIGFCMGGMYAMKAAATGRFDRAGSFYGMITVPDAWKGPNQGDALGALVKSGNAHRVLALIGTADPYTPEDDVDALEAAGATVIRYEGAEHGFVHDPARPAHRPDDAADAWRRLDAWLAP